MSGLASVSDRDLESNLKSLIRKERMLLHFILEHIKEVDSRRLYLDRSYSSMYEYLVREIGYSNSAAMRRLEAARLLNVVPILSDKIQDGSINLSQIGELARAIREKERVGEKISQDAKIAVVEQIAGLSFEQTQKAVAIGLDIELKDPERVKVQKDDSVHLSITLTREQYELLTSCKEKAAHSLQLNKGDQSWARVIEVVAGQYLDGRSFAAKVFSQAKVEGEIKPDNKTLTLKTRRYILNRDKSCQYVDKFTGKLCGSKYGLQVDHIIPQWSGGTHAPENLQALCGAHNKHKYRRESGIKIRSSS